MNVTHGVEVCDGDESYRHCLRHFLGRYQARAAELQSLPADRERIRELAHQLKSTASYLGLERVVAVAREAEMAVRSPDSVEVVQWRLHLALIEALAAISAFLSHQSDGSPG